MIQTITLTKVKARLDVLCEQVVQNQTIVIIRRRGKENVALVSASELSWLIETIHLLKPPRNAERLIAALTRALRHEVQTAPKARNMKARGKRAAKRSASPLVRQHEARLRPERSK